LREATELTDLNTEERSQQRNTESILVDGLGGPTLGARSVFLRELSCLRVEFRDLDGLVASRNVF